MSLFDNPKQTLNPKIFDVTTKIMLPNVKSYLMSKYTDIYPAVKMYRLVLLGSNVSYVWSEKSDIDINLMGTKGEDFDAWHKIFKKFNHQLNYLPGTKMPINYFFQEYVAETDWENSLGAYDIPTDTWLKKPIPPDKWGDPEQRFEREIANAKFLMSLLESEVINLKTAYDNRDERQITNSVANLRYFFQNLDDNRHLNYQYSINPALQEFNIIYKYIENSPYKTLLEYFLHED